MNDLYDEISEALLEVIEDLDEKKRKKKKKKKKKGGKKDACYHKVKSRYRVWPSAYASGALVKCRKVGAANWGNKSKKNESLDRLDQIIEEELQFERTRAVQAAVYAAADEDLDKFESALNTLGIKIDPRFVNDQIQKVRDLLNDPGYGSFDKATSYVRSLMANQTTSESLERIIKEELQAVLDEKKKKRKKRKKAGTESSKESSLRDWFGRKGAKGKRKGWVDCNAPDGKGGYKSCGRSSGEGRKKYPACRPTPGACKERGKGKSWGKKASKKKK